MFSTAAPASVSFWPLLILESEHVCPSTCFSRTNCLKANYIALRRGFFSDYSLQCLQKKAITIHVFARKKSTRLWGIFNNYKEKLSASRVHTAALIESQAWSQHSCNGRKHRCKHVSDSVPSSFDTREHFDYNIASLTGIVINCSVSSSCNDRSNY